MILSGVWTGSGSASGRGVRFILRSVERSSRETGAGLYYFIWASIACAEIFLNTDAFRGILGLVQLLLGQNYYSRGSETENLRLLRDQIDKYYRVFAWKLRIDVKKGISLAILTQRGLRLSADGMITLCEKGSIDANALNLSLFELRPDKRYVFLRAFSLKAVIKTTIYHCFLMGEK